MRKPRFEVEVFIPGATGVLGWHEVGESVPTTKKAARAAVDAAKVALGERGPVWWSDGAADYNRHLARNTPYASWYAGLDGSP